MSFFILLYITYFLIFSDKGLFNFFILKNNLKEKNMTYNKITLENENLINKINKLKLNSIDLDYLDELNVKHNGYIGNRDIVVVFRED
tara:strand:- start:7538 stop:7801 length:264 start_codon:yes stop_codon:yes gene_type:complete